MKNVHWANGEIDRLKILFPDNNDELVANILNRPQSGVQGKAVKLGLHKSKDYLKNRYKKLGIMNSQLRALPVNHNYFSNIDHQNKAYWLGWIWSDGNICTDKYSKIISLGLNYKDLKIIENFKQDLQSSHKIIEGKYIYDKYKLRHVATIKLASKQIFDDLLKYGITPRKTYDNTAPKNIPEQYLSHFIRGLFDGDGCITRYSKIPSNINVSISSTYTTCNWLLQTIKAVLDVGGGIYQHKHSPVSWEWKLQGRNGVIKFYQYIYHEAERFLERKYNKFKELGLLSCLLT